MDSTLTLQSSYSHKQETSNPFIFDNNAAPFSAQQYFGLPNNFSANEMPSSSVFGNFHYNTQPYSKLTMKSKLVPSYRHHQSVKLTGIRFQKFDISSKLRNQKLLRRVQPFDSSCSYSGYALLDNFITILYALRLAVKVKAPKKSTLFIATAFGDPSMNANLVRLEVRSYNSSSPLFRLNWLYSTEDRHFNDAPVADINPVCAMSPHLQHVDFPQLTSIRIRVVLRIDSMQYINESELSQEPKVHLLQYETS